MWKKSYTQGQVKSTRGVKKKKKSTKTSETVEKNSYQCDILETINVIYYRKCSGMFHDKSKGGKKVQNNVWTDYLKFYSALLKI